MRIKEAAGWNQTEEDWRCLLELAPETCFGVESGGVLAATTTAILYGSTLAWIGMVLTDPVYRHRGFALRLVEHAIGEATARGIAWIKLDATEMGEPIYRRLGFEVECGIERWGRVAGVSGGEGVAETEGDWAMLDREAFGADRSRLLGVLARRGVWGQAGEGFAMQRPGSEAGYFGPCVSRSTDAAARLIEGFLARHAGRRVFWDLLPGNMEAVRLAREFGFEPQRRLLRMALRARADANPIPRNDELAFAAAGFEYG